MTNREIIEAVTKQLDEIQAAEAAAAEAIREAEYARDLVDRLKKRAAEAGVALSAEAKRAIDALDAPKGRKA